MNILNQFSYPLIALSVVLTVFLLLRYVLRARWWLGVAVSGGVALAFAAGFLLLRTGSGDPLDDLDGLLRNNRPTFIEFFSNYCTGCLLLRPTVDAIIIDIADDYNVLRVNIHSAEGRQIRQRYAFSFTPEFIVLDTSGREIWRDHIPPTAETLARGLRSEG